MVAEVLELGMGMSLVTSFAGMMWRNHMDGNILPYRRWQYLALQEAREIMQEQKEEIANLRAKVRSLTHECSNEFSRELEDEMKEKGEECEALKREVLILSERSSMLRNSLVASYVGFGVVVGGIMVMSRW